MSDSSRVFAAVEGDLDEAVVRRLFEFVGATPGEFFGKRGKGHLEQKIAGYNNAARRDQWFVLVDLDGDACASQLVSRWLPLPSTYMRLRVAVTSLKFLYQGL